MLPLVQTTIVFGNPCYSERLCDVSLFGLKLVDKYCIGVFIFLRSFKPYFYLSEGCMCQTWHDAFLASVAALSPIKGLFTVGRPCIICHTAVSVYPSVTLELVLSSFN